MLQLDNGHKDEGETRENDSSERSLQEKPDDKVISTLLHAGTVDENEDQAQESIIHEGHESQNVAPQHDGVFVQHDVQAEHLTIASDHSDLHPDSLHLRQGSMSDADTGMPRNVTMGQLLSPPVMKATVMAGAPPKPIESQAIHTEQMPSDMSALHQVEELQSNVAQGAMVIPGADVSITSHNTVAQLQHQQLRKVPLRKRQRAELTHGHMYTSFILRCAFDFFWMNVQLCSL
jgi:hypothetical protein